MAESLVFVVMRWDDSEVQAHGICQPWGIKGGRARPQTAFWFLSSLRLHLFCVPRLTASCFCPFLLFTKRRKPQRGKEGKGCPCLKVFCAPADARRRKLCIARFHAGVKTDSRRCVSFPPHKRCAGLRGGVGEVWHGRVSGCSTPQSRTFQKIFSLLPVPPHAMKPAVTPPSCTNHRCKRLRVRKGA